MLMPRPAPGALGSAMLLVILAYTASANIIAPVLVQSQKPSAGDRALLSSLAATTPAPPPLPGTPPAQFPALGGFVKLFTLQGDCHRGAECTVRWFTDAVDAIDLSPAGPTNAAAIARVSLNLIRRDDAGSHIPQRVFIGSVVRKSITLAPREKYTVSFTVPSWIRVGGEYELVVSAKIGDEAHAIASSEPFRFKPERDLVVNTAAAAEDNDDGKFTDADMWARFFVLQEMRVRKDPRDIVRFCGTNGGIAANCAWILRHAGVRFSPNALVDAADILNIIEKTHVVLAGFPSPGDFLSVGIPILVNDKLGEFWDAMDPFRREDGAVPEPARDCETLRAHKQVVASLKSVTMSYIARLSGAFPELGDVIEHIFHEVTDASDELRDLHTKMVQVAKKIELYVVLRMFRAERIAPTATRFSLSALEVAFNVRTPPGSPIGFKVDFAPKTKAEN